METLFYLVEDFIAMNTKEYWIEKLELEPHPEGGYYKETYRSNSIEKFSDTMSVRNVSTAIYFLLTEGNFSAFHRIKSDEMWHFYSGDPISIFVIHKNDELEEIKLGLDLENGEQPQAVVPADTWFASRVAPKGSFSLVGCTVAPGFDFEDFQMAQRTSLIENYPKHKQIISQLTREI